MLKQSPSRNLRAGRGYKVKHVAQMCLMMVLTLWMLYQLRHCYFKKAVLEDTAGRIGVEKAGSSEKVVAKLGRKWLLPGVVEEDDDDEAKGAEEGRWDEFEQVDDLMEEREEQEIDDKEQENKGVDVVAERFTMIRNKTNIM